METGSEVVPEAVKEPFASSRLALSLYLGKLIAEVLTALAQEKFNVWGKRRGLNSSRKYLFT